MIIVDRALEKRSAAGNPIKSAMVGAGFMGRAIADQIVNSAPGIDLVAISNRNLEKARNAYLEAGIDAADIEVVETVEQLEAAIDRGRPAITEDALLLTRAGQIEAIVEVTGSIEFAARVVLDAIEHGKHMILMNAELDGTLGPILQVYAKRAGVIVTATDGDQPGVEMNLYRFVKGMGLTPLLCGNNKGLQDPYRNPTTQEGFAKKWGQDPWMVSSFADGTKMSFEQATVANATGMRVPKRGMNGFEFPGHFDELVSCYDADALRAQGGIVDYVVGAKPAPGVFVFGTHDDPKQRHYLNLYKLGEGPLYSFYTPYHLCHFEVPTSIARAVLFDDAVMVPLGGPVVDVVATAKTDLAAGTEIDAMGGYHAYGQAENHDVVRKERLLPIGLAVGCTLRRSVARDAVLTYDDVDVPPGRLHDRLRAEQDSYFSELPRA